MDLIIDFWIKEYTYLLYFCSILSLLSTLPYFYILESYELYYDKHESHGLSQVLLTIQRRNGQGKKDAPARLLTDLFRSFNYGTVLNTATSSDREDMRIRRIKKIKAKGTLRENIRNLVFSTLVFVNTFMLFMTSKSQFDLFSILSHDANILLTKLWSIGIVLIGTSKARVIKRKPLFVITSLIFMIIGILLFLTRNSIESNIIIQIIRNLLIYYVSKALAVVLIPILFAYFYELFPPSLRGRYLSIACMANYTVTAVSLFILDFLEEKKYDQEYPFYALSPFILLLSFYIPETLHQLRRGQVLVTEEEKRIETPRYRNKRKGTDFTLKRKGSNEVDDYQERYLSLSD